MTDAGYRNTWFRQVDKKGWFWLGRVRGKVTYQHNNSEDWHVNQALYPSATPRGRYIGEVKLGRKSPINCHLHLYKTKKKAVLTSALQKLAGIIPHKKVIELAVKSLGY
ncbi:transposase [Pseudoalteromonas rubra]|uniref:transposase n=1 Tax=Pseudoalteromonas rubra TaxID=43658 RepID=UPI002017FF0B|nr:transposase [Pseudoalteromonas rubra]